MKVRVVKTTSNANAVQVVSYQNNKRRVLQHIGSAHSDAELNNLKLLVEEWIKDYANQFSIFPDENPNKLLHISHSTFVGVKYHFFHNQIRAIHETKKLDKSPSLLNDLVVIRIFEPASKLRSLELLEKFFGIFHSRKAYYKIATDCIDLKRSVEQRIIHDAEAQYLFNYDILFYDGTTLYFETFEEDELRKNGFSKDITPIWKHRKPAIIQ